MPLSVDNILQSKTGNFNASSGSATLDAGTTTGSAVVICAAIGGGDLSANWEIDQPTGFDVIDTGVGRESFLGDNPSSATSTKVYCFIKSNTNNESSWTLTVRRDEATGSAQQVVWAAFEVTGIGLDPYQAGDSGQDERGVHTVNVSGTNSAVSTRSTGTTPGSSCYDTMAFGVWAALSSNTTPPTISGHTNGYSEIASVTRDDGTRAIRMSVAIKPILVTGTTESTASITASAPCYAGVGVFYADGAKFAPVIDTMCGFETGTISGIATGSAFYAGGAQVGPFDTSVGSPEVVTSHPRTGTYCLRLSSSSAAECLTWENPGQLLNYGPTDGYPLVARLNVYFETSLPGADVPLASFEAGSLANGVVIRYINSSQKIGVKVGTGTEQVSDATVAADKWVGLDLRYDARATTHKCDWQVDYDSLDTTAAPVLQTQASNTGMTVSNITIFRLGWSTSVTATVFYDDVVLAKQWGNFPIGDYRIIPLKPDPLGTPTVSGTSTNFRLYSSNGTLATWTAAGTITALDEVPVVIGGSSDGITQISNAANDYVNIPMETFAAAPSNVLRAARWYMAGWAASGTAATCAVRFYDGVELSDDGVILLGDHGFDNAATVWLTRMHRQTFSGGAPVGFYQLTQARLDALACRFGFSNDAAPDVGIHNVLVELAYQPADVFEISSGEGVTLDLRQDPVSQAVASYLLDTTGASTGATLFWTINAVDGSQHINAGNTYEKVIGADDINGVTSVGMIPD